MSYLAGFPIDLHAASYTSRSVEDSFGNRSSAGSRKASLRSAKTRPSLLRPRCSFQDRKIRNDISSAIDITHVLSWNACVWWTTDMRRHTTTTLWSTAFYETKALKN